MLRIHFTAEDLTRVRMAPGPEPMWEALLSAHLLDRSARVISFDSWRRQVLPQLTPHARMLATLAPPRGYSPDFLTPGVGGDDLGAGIEQVLATSPDRLRRELGLLARWRQPCSWIRRLAAGDPAVLQALGRGLREYHERVLAPYWPVIRTTVDAERMRRAAVLLEGGTERLLDGLHPTVRWRAPVLEVDGAADRDVRLAGRGLQLIPAFFCWRRPITLYDPDLPPVLVYPVEHPPAWADPGADDPHQALAALLGRTRAAILQSLAVSTSTSGVARKLAISVASASEHARVLREAGLIETRRERSAVRHTITPAGRDLLSAAQRAATEDDEDGQARESLVATA